jgi:hypothetical protein
MTQVTPVQLSLRELSRLVVLQTHKGKSRDEVVQVLVARGWPQVSAVRFVDMTLFEQGGRSARAWASEEEQQEQQEQQEQRPNRRAFSASPGSWKALLVAVLMMAVLMALLIASVLAVLAP